MTELEDLDFTRPAKSEIYDAATARRCFEALGSAESVPPGQPFFAEGEASERMYLLLDGEVSLIRGRKMIDIVKAGEIFGEMAVITHQPRSATAMARSACRTVSLDARQFQRAIQATPEFALMLMSILIKRLRLADAIDYLREVTPAVAVPVHERVLSEAGIAGHYTRLERLGARGRTSFRVLDDGRPVEL